MAIVARIKQLSNNNVQFQDGSGTTMDTFLPGTQFLLDASKNQLTTVARNQFPFSVRPIGTIILEYKDGSTTSFSGTAAQLYDKLYEPGGFFFESVGRSQVYPSGSAQPFFDTDGLAATSLNADTIYSRLIEVKGYATIDRLIGRFTAATPGNALLGIYNIGPNGYPADLLAQGAAINANVTAAQFAIFGSSVQLSPGFYAYAYNANVTNSFNCSPAASAYPNWGYDAAILAAGNKTVYSAAHVYTGSLPATFPAGAAATVNPPFILTQIS